MNDNVIDVDFAASRAMSKRRALVRTIVLAAKKIDLVNDPEALLNQESYNAVEDVVDAALPFWRGLDRE